MLLLIAFVGVDANHGTAIATFRGVAVPEYFHKVAGHGIVPDGMVAPFVVAQVLFVFRFFEGFGHGAAESVETESRFQVVHQHCHTGAVGVGASPATLAVALVQSILVDVVGDSHKRLEVEPC